MEKVRARISEMPNRCILVVESSGRARYSNIEEEIGHFGVSPEYAPVPSILTPPGAPLCLHLKMHIAEKQFSKLLSQITLGGI